MTEPDYKGFAVAIMHGWPEPEGVMLDGFDLQELAEKHGLLQKQERTEPCGPNCWCKQEADFWPVECYRSMWVTPSQDTTETKEGTRND